jgi:hypothetical protein
MIIQHNVHVCLLNNFLKISPYCQSNYGNYAEYDRQRALLLLLIQLAGVCAHKAR